MRAVSVAFAALALAGCSVGIKHDGSNADVTSFSVPFGYQEAYRRADAHAHECHTSANVWKGSQDVSGNLYTDTKEGVVRVSMPTTGGDLERIEVKDNAGSTAVIVSLWDRGRWHDKESVAVRESIENGHTVCRENLK